MPDSSGEPVPSKRSRSFRENWNRLSRLLIELRAAAIQTAPDDKGHVSATFSLLQQIGYRRDDARKIMSAATQGRKRGRPPGNGCKTWQSIGKDPRCFSGEPAISYSLSLQRLRDPADFPFLYALARLGEN